MKPVTLKTNASLEPVVLCGWDCLVMIDYYCYYCSLSCIVCVLLQLYVSVYMLIYVMFVCVCVPCACVNVFTYLFCAGQVGNLPGAVRMLKENPRSQLEVHSCLCLRT